MKALALFGSTGSIGGSTLDVVRAHPEHFSVRYLAARSSVDRLCAQVEEFAPRAVAVEDRAAAARVRERVGAGTEVLEGAGGLLELARRDDYDMLVSSLVGFAGMRPTIAAIEAGKAVALANKETLVVAGEIITRLLATHRVPFLPIDSEHSAIMQCLAGETTESIARIVLTASGGPFRGRTRAELATVTRKQALKHPNWSMGHKITIDSATLMNKGLEVIEAHWLFSVPGERIDVLVHPQSIIHSMVEFTDGSVKAQLGPPDMKLPIHFALSWPDRRAAAYPRLDFSATTSLTFEAPDPGTFRCLALAYEALHTGGTAPAILNAANEVAVAAFLDETIGFLDIPAIIEECLSTLPVAAASDIDTVVAADHETRRLARHLAAGRAVNAVHTA